MKVKTNKIHLPTLRGKMGDWFYYVTILTFDEIRNRVKQPSEIAEYSANDNQLGNWIQRELQAERTKQIVNYLTTQDQRFFNSLILGIYGGSPFWQEIDLKDPTIDETTLDYLNQSLGVLTLTGDENIFAIDGQHRAIAIREALNSNEFLGKEEISVIFLAHRTDAEGLIRTRRLFSTLNRYAKPVSQSETIKLSEDDNAAIITRRLIEDFDLFKDKILLNKNRSIARTDKLHFSNISVIYDFVKVWFCSIPVFGHQVEGWKEGDFLHKRLSEKELEVCYNDICYLFQILIKNIPSLRNFFYEATEINRDKPEESLLFRPIGQNVLVYVLKVSLKHKKIDEAIAFFAKDTFCLSDENWRKIFWDSDTDEIESGKPRQKFATLLILQKIGIDSNYNKKDAELLKSFDISIENI